MKILLDTNLLVRAAISPLGSAREMLRAVAGEVDVLCTSDKHFYKEEVVAFCAAHGIQIMNDVDLLRLLRGRQK